MLPIVSAGHRSPAKTAALSALAVFAMGGVNASATLLVLPLPLLAIWFAPLGGPNPPRRRRLTVYWIVAVVAATLWWAVPLALLGSYGFNFLPYTESASVTTGITGLGAILHGSDHWLDYLYVRGFAQHPAALLAHASVRGALATAVVVGLAFVGIGRRAYPARRWIIASLFVGAAIIGAGHDVSVGAPLAHAPVRDWLNGALAPLRNLAKADAVVRLPIVLAAAEFVGALRLPWVRPVIALWAVATLVVALFGVSPGLPASKGFPAIPAYWHQAAAWLDAQPGDGSVLIEPGASFAQLTWGDTIDEPLQPLLHHREFMVRAQAPAGSVGISRIVNTIDDRLTTGQGSPALGRAMLDMGVKWVVVRADLDAYRNDPVYLPRVTQALEQSGYHDAADFGPTLGVSPQTSPLVVHGLVGPAPQVRIYAIDGDVSARSYPASDLTRLDGAPEDTLDLPARPYVLDGDPGSNEASSEVQTDGLRRRELSFGPLREDPPTLTAGQPFLLDNPAHDLLGADWRAPQAVAVQTGGTVTASSYSADAIGASDPDASVNGLSSPGQLPEAAFDGNASSKWVSASGGATGQWIEVALAAPINASEITIDPAVGVGPPVQAYTVTTDHGSVTRAVRVDASSVIIPLPAGSTKTVRVTVEAVWGSDHAYSQTGIAEVSIPGVDIARHIAVGPVSTSPDAVHVTRSTGLSPACTVLNPGNPVCAAFLAGSEPEPDGFDRSVTTTSGLSGPISGTAVFTGDAAAVSGLLPAGWTVHTSSTLVPGAPAWGTAAVDGDPDTAWWPAANDPAPTITVDFGTTETITGLKVVSPTGYVSRPITGIKVSAGGRSESAFIDFAGDAVFPALTGTSFSVQVGGPDRKTTGPTGELEPLSYAVDELTFVGGSTSTEAADVTLSLPCGSGPSFTVGGRRIETAVSAKRADLLAGLPVAFTGCTPADVAAGTWSVTSDDAAWRVQQVDVAAQSAAVGAPVPRTSASSSAQALVVTSGPAQVVVLDQNYNAGWQAELGGHTVPGIVLDGWRQGYLIPAGVGGVLRMTFTPQRLNVVALAVGALALIGLGVVAVAPSGAMRRTARRRPERPVPTRFALPRWTISVGLVLGLAVLGGVAGAVLGLVAAVTVAVARRRPGLIRVVRIALLVIMVQALAFEACILAWQAYVNYAQHKTLSSSLVDAPRQVALLIALACCGGLVLAGGWDPAPTGEDRPLE